MPKLSVICEILLGSLCNRMPQIFPTLRIPFSNVGERVSRKAICFIRPEIRSVIRRVRILKAVPKFLPAALFKHHNFSWRFFHFLPRQMDAPPIYPDPALTVPRGSFLMSKVGGTFPWKLERRLADQVRWIFRKSLVWPMAMGGGLRSSYNNISSMKDEWLFVCFSHGLTYEEGESSYKIWRFREILWFDVFS